nr:putative RNA-directed DNA polymerase [Tanacetum cinerariifolium]
MVFNQKDTPLELNEHVKEQKNSFTQEETSERYVLPPRANQEVPQKRYSLEKVSRGSRYPMANIAKGNLSKDAKAFDASVYSDEIFANTEQALNLRKWKKAMEEEMEALTKNNTQEKCVLKPGKKIVGCRWVFTNKYKPDVAKINTIRVLCSIAANKGWPLDQFDEKNAFLHRELKEEVYMEAPHGYTKSLEKGNNSDHTLFVKQGGNLIRFLIIYVDDMIVTGDDKEEITKLKKYLFIEFKMKDLGRLKYFLGIGVLRSKQGIFMCQKMYILDLLAETGDKGNRRSTSGYFTVVGGNLVTWRSKKQKVVSLSSAEAKFLGIAKGLTKVLWVRRLLSYALNGDKDFMSKWRRDTESSMDSCWTCGNPFHPYKNYPKEKASRKERVPETYEYRSQYDAYECDTYHANYNIEIEDDTMYRGQSQGDDLSFNKKYDKIMSMIESNKEENQIYEASFAAHEASFVALETHVDWLLKQLNRDETYEPQGITKLDFDDEDKDEEDVDDHNDSFEDLISPIKEHDKESVPFKDGEEVMEANTTPSSQL